MYTGTIFNWHDNSAFEVGPAAVDAVNRPLFMVVNSFDKGPEKLMEVDANTFYSMYGTMSFDKHGQGSIQADRIVNAGGRLLVKRVCAADSKIANSILVATLESTSLDKVDDEGQYIYLDTEGQETYAASHTETDPTTGETVLVPNEHATTPGVAISWSVESADDCKTFEDVKKKAKTLRINNNYPLFVISDNGRGKSNKAVRVIPDYDTSRGLEQMIYRWNVYEDTSLLETMNISFDPNYKFDAAYYGLDKNRNTQITAEVIPAVFEEYAKDIAKIIYQSEDNPTAEEIAFIKKQDLIFGYSFTGDFLNGLSIKRDPQRPVIDPTTHEITPAGDPVGTDLSTTYGIPMGFAGSNGIYGDTPANYAEGSNSAAYQAWSTDIANVYRGVDTDGSSIDEVWDVDSHKIFAVADANYPIEVKDAMAEFVMFRKDCIMLRDLGIGYNTLAAIKTRYAEVVTKYKARRSSSQFTSANSNFIADYYTTYEIEDPDTLKNITVTMIYDLVACMTDMYINRGPFVPIAGVFNGYILENAIPGTINYTPIITPNVNQKEAIDNLRINYAIFENGDQCVVQSTYSSQKANTQLSWINNTIAIQEVARQVRIACPKNRFRLITSNDLSEYAQAVENILEAYRSNFDVLQFTYTQDPLKLNQKIFYASINFAFSNWAQTEIFDLYAITNTSTTANTSITTEY